MKNKIRGINYPTSNGHTLSTVYRKVGDYINVNTPDGLMKITIKEIVEVPQSFGLTKYAIYGSNEKGEYGLWKEESDMGMKVEYDIKDLLSA